MHCELLVPGLLCAADAPRAPALDLLLGRGRARREAPHSAEAWLQRAFRLDALPAGALSALAHGLDAGAAQWVRADPVHLRLLRDRATIVPGEALRITHEEARQLAAALNAHFADRFEIHLLEPARWIARTAEKLSVEDRPAVESAGAAAVPQGAADALLTEVQMALHEHPVNAAREARGEPPVNSVWLWGAGAALRPASAPWASLTAADPVARGLARGAGLRSPAPAGGDAWLSRVPEEGRHLVVLDALRPFAALGDAEGFAAALAALEREWFAPLLGALRAGRVGMLTLHAPDGERSLTVETIRGDLRRIWRRPRPVAAWMG